MARENVGKKRKKLQKIDEMPKRQRCDAASAGHLLTD